MSLLDWERNGWLTRHQTSRNEIRQLLQVVERDLADSAAEGLPAAILRDVISVQALQSYVERGPTLLL
jgi:hypothetical protein